MKRIMALVSLLAAVCTAALAWPSHSTGGIEITVDGAAFSDTKGMTWQQLYWSFPAAGLVPAETLVNGSPVRLSRFRTVIQIKDSIGIAVLDEDWNTVVPMPSESELKRKKLIRLDQIDARSLRPGPYRLSFTVTDLVGGKAGQLETGLIVPAIRADRPGLSQIELCTDVKPDTVKGRFYKGGLRVMPNPGHIYTETVNIAYYYFEVYGLTAPAGTRLRISYNSDNDSVTGTIADESLAGSGASLVRVGGITLDGLPEGGYQLWAQLLDSRNRPLAAASAAFTIKRNPLAAMPGSEKMIDEQAELVKQGGAYYQRIEYIANSRQMDTYHKLDSMGRREFLRQFWKARDTDPKTPENEALAEHVRRYQYVDEHFSENINNGIKGSQSDRGRIYIKLGDPDEIEAKPMDQNAKPSLIWRYPRSQKVIFVDVNGFGRYQLVWTNIPGEHNDPNYKKLLSTDMMDAESIAY